MSLRRAVGFLLARRFSPRATPRTAPARSLHTLRDLPIGEGLRGAAGVVAAALAGGGALAYFKKGPDVDESAAPKKEEDLSAAAPKKEEDLKARFEDWMKENDRTYRDEEEKAMRFQLYKATIKWIESQPPSYQKYYLPENCFADFKDEELPSRRSCVHIDTDSEEYRRDAKFIAEYEKGGPPTMAWRPAVKQGDKQATQVSA